MRISGHKTRSVFIRYDIISDHDLQDAARKMGQKLEFRHLTGTSKQSSAPEVAQMKIFEAQ